MTNESEVKEINQHVSNSRSAQAEKEPVDSRSIMQKNREIFQQRIENHEVDRLINPFSEFWGDNKHAFRETLQNAKAVWKDADKRTQLTKADEKYGKPVAGTLTEKRGQKARDFITKNIIECCETVRSTGTKQSDGTYHITFGLIFKAYERINDKVVGMLLRARKHGLMDFPGEMLYQGQDDKVIITLFKVPTFDELNLKFVEFDYEKSKRKAEREIHSCQ